MLAILKLEYDRKIITINLLYFLMIGELITLDKYSECASKFAGSVDLETQGFQWLEKIGKDRKSICSKDNQ